MALFINTLCDIDEPQDLRNPTNPKSNATTPNPTTKTVIKQ